MSDVVAWFFWFDVLCVAAFLAAVKFSSVEVE
jgi:hypothetical protein